MSSERNRAIRWFDIEKEIPELPVIRSAKTREEMIEKVKSERLKEIIEKLRDWKGSQRFIARLFRKSDALFLALLDQLQIEHWKGRRLPLWPVLSPKPFKTIGKVNDIETKIVGVVPTPIWAYTIGWVIGDGTVIGAYKKLYTAVRIYQKPLELIPIIDEILRHFGTPILYWRLGPKEVNRFGELLERNKEEAMHVGKELYAKGIADHYYIYVGNAVLARLCGFHGRWRGDVLEYLMRDWTLSGYFCAGLWDADGSVRKNGLPEIVLADRELLELLYTSYKRFGIHFCKPYLQARAVDVANVTGIKQKKTVYVIYGVNGRHSWRKWARHTGLKMRHMKKLKRVKLFLKML